MRRFTVRLKLLSLIVLVLLFTLILSISAYIQYNKVMQVNTAFQEIQHFEKYIYLFNSIFHKNNSALSDHSSLNTYFIQTEKTAFALKDNDLIKGEKQITSLISEIQGICKSINQYASIDLSNRTEIEAARIKIASLLQDLNADKSKNIAHLIKETQTVVNNEAFDQTISLQTKFLSLKDSISNSDKEKFSSILQEVQKADIAKNQLQNKITELSELFNHLDQSVSKFSGLSQELLNKKSENVIIYYILFIIILALGFSVGIYFTSLTISKPIQSIKSYVQLLVSGALPDKLSIKNNDELSDIANELNVFIERLSEKASFAEEIGKGKLDTDYQPISKQDVLGIALTEMKDRLHAAKEEEEKRKIEDKKQNWATEGLAKFADILRNSSSNIKELSDEIVKNIVKYLGANQGGLFILNQENDTDKHLELISSYAFDRKKFITKRIEIGEGLVGTAAIEKQTINITDVPEDYVKITSGLGDANPKNILIIPLKQEEEIFGILELASFKKFETHEIVFIEKVGENIASTLAAVKVNQTTTELLERTQQQAEEMKSQEEEMRQNLEEMLATQEEASRREVELSDTIKAVDKSVALIEYSFDGTISAFNELSSNLYGFTQNEVLGSKINMLDDSTDEDSTKAMSELWNKVNNNQYFEGILKRKNKEGKQVIVKLIAYPFLDHHGNPVKIMELDIDLTAIKTKEEELQEKTDLLQEQEEEMRLNMEELMSSQDELLKKEASFIGFEEAVNNTLAVIKYDIEGNIEKANENAASLFGISVLDLQEMNHNEFVKKEEKESPEYEQFWQNLIAGIPQEGEFIHITPN
ncbi:MAG: hypothetical protein C0594_13025, partial [Marinilabiliales bacterium]